MSQEMGKGLQQHESE